MCKYIRMTIVQEQSDDDGTETIICMYEYIQTGTANERWPSRGCAEMHNEIGHWSSTSVYVLLLLLLQKTTIGPRIILILNVKLYCLMVRRISVSE